MGVVGDNHVWGQGGRPGVLGPAELHGAARPHSPPLRSLPLHEVWGLALRPCLPPQRGQAAVFLPCGQPFCGQMMAGAAPAWLCVCQVLGGCQGPSAQPASGTGTGPWSSPPWDHVATWTEWGCGGRDTSGLSGPTAAQPGTLAPFSECLHPRLLHGDRDTHARHLGTLQRRPRPGLPLAHLVESLHDHVGQVLVQHGWRDDHLVEGLVVTPDGEVRGLLLLAAAEGHRGQREAEGGWQPDLDPPGPGSVLLWLSRGGMNLEDSCPAWLAGLHPWAPSSCLILSPHPCPQPGTEAEKG